MSGSLCAGLAFDLVGCHSSHIEQDLMPTCRADLTDVAVWNIVINEAHWLLTVWAFGLALELELSHVANSVHMLENYCCHFTSLLMAMGTD